MVSVLDEGASTSLFVINRGSWEYFTRASRPLSRALYLRKATLFWHGRRPSSSTTTLSPSSTSSCRHNIKSMADEGSPIMFKRKGARNTQRARLTDSEPGTPSEAGSDTAGTGEDSPSVLAAKLKNKLKTRNKPKSKLSFGADEDVRGCIPPVNCTNIVCKEGDGEVFKVKKSNLSRKIALGKPVGTRCVSCCFQFVLSITFFLSNVKPSSFDPLATPISASTSSGPSYSAAYLSELKAATPGSRPKLSEGDSFTLDEDVMNVDSIIPAAVPPEVVDLTGK